MPLTTVDCKEFYSSTSPWQDNLTKAVHRNLFQILLYSRLNSENRSFRGRQFRVMLTTNYYAKDTAHQSYKES